jgi:site-specific DNA recombinase
MNEKYFLYARKSTDVEDKQVLSIEAQLVELRNYAKQESLQIIDELVEKQSAKTPGRRVFGEMLRRIESSEAKGILAWHPDRLARNSIDGGQIVYLLDQTHLTSLKFPTFWFENTSQGKFMLSIAFGQSKYYVDNLSENTKRGLRQKVRRGEYPSHAPIGYINDLRNKSIVVDKRRAPIVKQAYELYVKNTSNFQDISDFLAKHGILTRGGKHLTKDQAKHILSNPFYYGHFRYAGELYEGKHTPIISKKLFDEVQKVLAIRGRPRKQKSIHPKVFCGLLRCGSCNLMVTGEKRIKHQKNGNVHEYVYYHCTKKRKDMKCLEPHIREEELDSQLLNMLSEYAMPDTWAKDLQARLNKDEETEQNSSGVFIAEAQGKIANLQSKLQRLLDSYLDQDIDRETYLQKKAEFMSEKKSLEERKSKFALTSSAWVEPMREWIKTANSICKTAQSADLNGKKALAKEIFGTNLILKSRKAQPTAAHYSLSPPENIWLALRATKEKAALSGDKFQFSPEMAGTAGFEPATSGTKNRCHTIRPRPITICNSSIKINSLTSLGYIKCAIILA